MSVVAEMSDGRMVPLHENVGETCEDVAHVLTDVSPTDWVRTADDGVIRAGRIIALWPEEKRW